MKYYACDMTEMKDAILEMSTRHPEIDSHIEGVLNQKKKLIDMSTMKRLKEVIMLYCGRAWVQSPKVAFVAYCMQEFYQTDRMFSNDVKKTIFSFLVDNSRPEQLELL